MLLKLLYIHRKRGSSVKSHGADGNRRTRARERVSRAIPALEANVEIQSNLDVSETCLFM